MVTVTRKVLSLTGASAQKLTVADATAETLVEAFQQMQKMHPAMEELDEEELKELEQKRFVNAAAGFADVCMHFRAPTTDLW
jgi:hypothetical protein